MIILKEELHVFRMLNVTDRINDDLLTMVNYI